MTHGRCEGGQKPLGELQPGPRGGFWLVLCAIRVSYRGLQLNYAGEVSNTTVMAVGGKPAPKSWG